MRSTSGKIFLDTNVFIHALDGRTPSKRARCREIIRALAASRTAVISTQVMQEFYVVATRKLGADPVLVKSMLASLSNLELVTVTPEMIGEAVDLSILNRLSFWDALIVASASVARCEALVTEDLNHGQVVHGVRIESPFPASGR
ncbi:MAG: PIN domain-containing protein [Deltaproteobacteria bacterium]|nr:PIN domain-containing protein [Deltaproteobacteria bacterium]